MDTIDLNRAHALQAEIDAINRMNFSKAVILQDGQPIDLSARMRDDLRFTGLSNFALLQTLGK